MNRIKLLVRVLGLLGLALFIVLIVRQGVGELAASLAAAGFGLLALAGWHVLTMSCDGLALRQLMKPETRISAGTAIWTRWLQESVNNLLPVMQIGGNLGTPALSFDPLEENGTFILEMSSFQLDLTLSITWDIAVLLNISPDHLDRHGGMDGYIAAKRQIFHRQTDPKSAIIGIDDKYCEAIYEELADIGDQVIVPISGERRIHGGVYAIDGILIDDMDGREIPVTDLRNIPALQGPHNWQNAAAAYAACRRAGIEGGVIMACLQSFPGLAHRQEAVEVVDGVAFVNDSKATNAVAAAKALACYDDIYWIAGGKPKDGGIDGLAPFYSRIRHAFLVGEAALGFGQILDGKVPFSISGEVATAVKQAFDLARKERPGKPVVLLSPACASYDQFSGFEARGDAFKAAVETLPGEHLDPSEAPEAFKSGGEVA